MYKAWFKKTVWGSVEINAKSKEEALKKFDDDEYDEEDTETEYQWMKRIVKKEGNCTIIDGEDVSTIGEALWVEDEKIY